MWGILILTAALIAGTDGFRSRHRVSDRPKEMPGCGASRPALLEGAEGRIFSPTSTGITNYPHNSLCQWRVTVPQGKRAHLHVERFSLEATELCRYDHLEVYDGADSSSTKLGRYCGNNIPRDITTTSHVIFIQFTSDSSVADTGFNITYSAEDAGGPKETPGCGASRPSLLEGAEGRIFSPTSMGITNYPHNSLCQWRVTVPQGKRAHLHVERFSLEATELCRYDHLEVYDGADSGSTKLGRYCGNNIPRDITTTSHVIFIQFTSDSSVADTGFNIIYSAEDAGDPFK